MIFQADASQLEWRTALELSQDWVGINEILEGQDTHANNQKAFDLPSRLIAKIFLFRTIFRGSGWAFANDPDFMHVSTSAEFWDSLNEKFYAKYYTLDKTHKQWAELVMNGKPIEGPLGRSWTLSRLDKQGNIKIPWTTLSNYPVQGTGADVMMIARIMARKRITNAGIPCKWRSTVHDSIVLDTTVAYLNELRDIFDSVFADLPKTIEKLFGYKWVTPMACECKYGVNMKEMKKFS
jgi:DNA polymerase I